MTRLAGSDVGSAARNGASTRAATRRRERASTATLGLWGHPTNRGGKVLTGSARMLILSPAIKKPPRVRSSGGLTQPIRAATFPTCGIRVQAPTGCCQAQTEQSRLPKEGGREWQSDRASRVIPRYIRNARPVTQPKERSTAQRGFPGNGPVVDPACALRPGPQATLTERSYKASRPATGKGGECTGDGVTVAWDRRPS